jgi:hypothetical protein
VHMRARWRRKEKGPVASHRAEGTLNLISKGTEETTFQHGRGRIRGWLFR